MHSIAILFKVGFIRSIVFIIILYCIFIFFVLFYVKICFLLTCYRLKNCFFIIIVELDSLWAEFPFLILSSKVIFSQVKNRRGHNERCERPCRLKPVPYDSCTWRMHTGYIFMQCLHLQLCYSYTTPGLTDYPSGVYDKI